MSKLILSLDGGGIRGAAATQFLEKVEEKLSSEHGKSIRDCVDFYAGTSTGSIIALALATTNLTMSQINELYNFENAAVIFTENKGWFDVDGINAPKYEAAGKTEILKNNFKNAKIKDVPKDKHVLAVTYGIERRKPEIIKSSQKKFLEILSYQAADASSAAPTYFPTKELDITDNNGMQDDFWLVDGGVIANNPAMCAIAEAKKAWKNLSFKNLKILSVGTGSMARKINGPQSKKWGALQWATKGHILDILSDERVVAYQAITITDPGNYIRVNAELKQQPGLLKPPDDAMDDVSKGNINKLKDLGNFWFERYGKAAIELLLGSYNGPSLDRIDPKNGQPMQRA